MFLIVIIWRKRVEARAEWWRWRRRWCIRATRRWVSRIKWIPFFLMLATIAIVHHWMKKIVAIFNLIKTTVKAIHLRLLLYLRNRCERRWRRRRRVAWFKSGFSWLHKTEWMIIRHSYFNVANINRPFFFFFCFLNLIFTI